MSKIFLLCCVLIALLFAAAGCVVVKTIDLGRIDHETEMPFTQELHLRYLSASWRIEVEIEKQEGGKERENEIMLEVKNIGKDKILYDNVNTGRRGYIDPMEQVLVRTYPFGNTLRSRHLFGLSSDSLKKFGKRVDAVLIVTTEKPLPEGTAVILTAVMTDGL